MNYDAATWALAVAGVVLGCLLVIIGVVATLLAWVNSQLLRHIQATLEEDRIGTNRRVSALRDTLAVLRHLLEAERDRRS